MSSKVLLCILSYNLNKTDPDICNALLNTIENLLDSDGFKEQLDLINCDVTLDAKIFNDKIDVIVTLYLTKKNNESILKKLRTYIDNNLANIDVMNECAKMIKRRVF